jgi:hypothetical protein
MHDWPRKTGHKGIVTFGVTREQGAFLQVAQKPLALSAAAPGSRKQLVESKVPG